MNDHDYEHKFWTAVSYTAGVALVAITAWVAREGYYQWRAQQDELRLQQAINSQFHPPPLPVAELERPTGHYETHHIAGQSKEACLKQTNGEINWEFIRCREGYDYQTWITGH